jgi:pantoate--beta-alanine ligase
VSRGQVKVVRSIAELREVVRGWRQGGKRIGLVPTMGALHEGHLALVRTANAMSDRTVVSIFVNPTQFAPNEDFARYPRDEAGDLEKLSAIGCDLVWMPDVAEMYPAGFATSIVPKGPAEGLESDHRPNFFTGVATVCTKLFTQVTPDLAVFGEKDYQQLCVVRQVVRDLDLPIEIVAHPTVREPDGLAMSSRNTYMSPAERSRAPLIYQTLVRAARDIAEGSSIAAATSRGREELTAAGFKVDYFEVRDARTLGVVEDAAKRPLRVLAAAWLGETRLIDNVPLE